MDTNNTKNTKNINNTDSLKVLIVLLIIFFAFILFIFNTSNVISNTISNAMNASSSTQQLTPSGDNIYNTVSNGEYYDYSKLNIQPTITILPAKIYDNITEIEGSIISSTLASDEYNNYYRIYSSTDKATILTPDMIPKINTKEIPKEIIEFIWTDVNSGKCYIPEYFSRNYDKVVLGDCSGNNAKYAWEDGFIKHNNSNRYLQTWDDNDNPQEGDAVSLSNMEDINRAEKRKFDFIQTANSSSGTKIIHRPSEKCVLPKIGTDGKVLLSVKKC
jgi:hypothetical protein